MSSRRVVLNFPPHLIDQPITYHLIRDYDLKVNILRARITPNEWGQMVVDINGNGENLERGLAYLAETGVVVQPLDREVRWLEDRCIQCSACVAHCPTQALTVDRATMAVAFHRDRCIACELCLNVCAYQAMEMSF